MNATTTEYGSRFAQIRIFVIVIALALLSGCASKSSVSVFDFGADTVSEETFGVRTTPATVQGGSITTPNDKLAIKLVREQVEFLTAAGAQPRFAQWLKRSEDYLPHAVEVFRRRGLPVELAYLPYMESGYSPTATSHAGAAGVWQFMHMTGRRFGLRYDRYEDQRRDSFKAAEAAASYFTILYGEFGDWLLALAAYNAGEGTIRRAMKATGAKDFFELVRRNDRLSRKRRVKDETMTYVPRFLAIAHILRNLDRYGFDPLRMDRAPRMVRFTVPGGTGLAALRRATGMSEKAFAAANPALRTGSTPPRRSAHVYVPERYAASARSFFGGTVMVASHTATKTVPKATSVRKTLARKSTRPATTTNARSAVAVHTVRSGDTLYSIARGHNVSVAALKRANGLSSDAIRVGQRLAVGTVPASGTRTATATRVASGTGAVSRSVYRVKSGDTLYSIARRHGVSHRQIMRANSMADADIVPGQRLVIVAAD